MQDRKQSNGAAEDRGLQTASSSSPRPFLTGRGCDPEGPNAQRIGSQTQSFRCLERKSCIGWTSRPVSFTQLRHGARRAGRQILSTPGKTTLSNAKQCLLCEARSMFRRYETAKLMNRRVHGGGGRCRHSCMVSKGDGPTRADAARYSRFVVCAWPQPRHSNQLSPRRSLRGDSVSSRWSHLVLAYPLRCEALDPAGSLAAGWMAAAAGLAICNRCLHRGTFSLL